MLRKIISGGQTGADRAGLDFAIKVELSSNSYPVRTKRNIRESDERNSGHSRAGQRGKHRAHHGASLFFPRLRGNPYRLLTLKEVFAYKLGHFEH